MMDGTAANPNQFEYQKRVAALIALTQKVKLFSHFYNFVNNFF
jgi:hypothetical protein